MKKAHAIHNESLCIKLFDEKVYTDWVVTTAFYSSLHYVQHEVFPKVINGVTYNTFEDFYKTIQRSQNKISKHKTTINLVSTYLTDIQAPYKWLFDACMSARYHNFRVSEKKADKAINQLNLLKSNLSK